MQKIISVSPFRCRMWALHDRMDEYVTETSCKDEIESFAKHGQLVPALGRRLVADPHHDVELIYGARRLFVARHINTSLLVEMRDLTDSEAIIAMDIENRQRADITPYERGVSYMRWMRAGHFTSQDEIARALQISASQVSRLLKLASLPAVVVDAFENPRDICETWGSHLMDALEDQRRRELTVRAAREMRSENPRLPGKDVYRRLLAATSPGRKVTAKNHDEVVKDTKGTPLFRVRRHRASLAFVVPIERISASRLELIRETLADVLSQDVARSSSAGRRETEEIRIVSDDARHRSARIADKCGESASGLAYDEVMPLQHSAR